MMPRWLLPIGIVFGLVVSHMVAYNHGVNTERTRQQLVIAGTSNAALVVARDIETAQAVATVEAVRDAQSDLSAIPDVRPELDSLRDSNARLRGELSRAAADAQRGQTATSAAMVLSEMLTRAEKRIAELEPIATKAVQLADAYDRSRIAGNLCTSIADDWQKRNAPHKP